MRVNSGKGRPPMALGTPKLCHVCNGVYTPTVNNQERATVCGDRCQRVAARRRAKKQREKERANRC